MQPVIPVLMADINRLSQPIDIIKYILQWYTHTPKNINDTFADQEISFRFDDATAGHNPEEIKTVVRVRLLNTLKKYFPTGTVTVDVTTTAVDDVRYNINIDILVILDGTPYSLSNNYVVDKDGYLTYNLIGD